MTEQTMEYYQKNIDDIYTVYNKILDDRELEYDPYLNTPFSKSTIQLKYEFKLDTDLLKNDIYDILIDKAFNSFILTSLKNLKPTTEQEIIFSLDIQQESAAVLKKHIDKKIDYKYDSDIMKDIDSIKYIFFGNKDYSIISSLILFDKTYHSIKANCFGDYRGIQIYFIPSLTEIYIANNPIISLNTMIINYNEYINQNCADKYSVDNQDMIETIPNKDKTAVATFNCIQGDIKIYKYNSIYMDGVAYYRNLKLNRILNN